MDIVYISLLFGLTSCVFVFTGFSYETYSVYKSKSSETLTLGSLGLQIVSASSGCIAASLNTYSKGIENIPFIITNGSILINLILLLIMKYKFQNNH